MAKYDSIFILIKGALIDGRLSLVVFYFHILGYIFIPYSSCTMYLSKSSSHVIFDSPASWEIGSLSVKLDTIKSGFKVVPDLMIS